MTAHRDDAAGTGPSSESLQGRIQILNRAGFESDPTAPVLRCRAHHSPASVVRIEERGHAATQIIVRNDGEISND
jgi:hypothetical protein